MSTDDEIKAPEQAPLEEDKRHASAWAEAKGMLPQLLGTNAATGVRQNPEYWKYAAAVAHRTWSETDLVTEADFDAAVLESTSQISR